MGQGKSNFTKQELEEYEELTYLSNSEVLQAFKKYRDIDPPTVKFYIFLQNSC
jgi:calcium and integrin-binding protein 1